MLVKVLKRLNNNAVMCVDSSGRQVVAFGKGIAFALPKDSDELPLKAIERTFYDIDDHYLQLLDEIKPQVLSLAADLADDARNELPYELSPNVALALADHISFALERHRHGISVAMPLAYDVNQLYPVELALGRRAAAQISRDLNVELPASEAVGIAMCLINAMSTPEGADGGTDLAREDDALIEDIARIIERRYGITVDRRGFEYARFATHVRYLLQRLRTGEHLTESSPGMYEAMREHAHRSGECLDEACSLLRERCGAELSDSEKLYLLLHIVRVGRARHEASA